MIDSKLLKIRSRVGELKAEIDRLKSDAVPVPQAAALARVDAIVERLKAAGDQTLNALAGRLTHQVTGYVQLVDVDHGRNPDAPAQIMAAIDSEKLRSSLHSRVKSAYSEISDVASPSEIQARIAKLTVELESTERQDFKLSNELCVPQRADVDPRLLLGG